MLTFFSTIMSSSLSCSTKGVSMKCTSNQGFSTNGFSSNSFSTFYQTSTRTVLGTVLGFRNLFLKYRFYQDILL